ncbi:transcription termination factor MTERF2, chloroplastic-like [Cynara cardunculus var. scolymus]|uniref:transcription termination factor MTERF2, chloroplastic-like n=1 Tax=Cynara cardunculus var. scolymus TaxID=59895 RepID=UPI000D626178|nr:transcription termination factor MTERF2, chloroplastic-like [Cynara cardunculus var. scolymus]
MLILRIKSSNNHELSSSISALQLFIHAHYSTKSTQKHPITKHHFMVDYLVNSLGFSQDQALSTATKVSHIKSTQKPDSVVDFFKQCGLGKTQIRNIVCFSPKILTTSVDKILEPKFRVFQELGLSGSGLEKLFKPTLGFSNNRLTSNVNYLRELLDSDDKVIKVIHKSWWLLSTNFAQKLSANLLVLKKYGFSNGKIENLLMKNPGCLLQSPEWLETTIKKVEPVLGIPRESPRFVDGFETVASMTNSKLETKFEVYRSFGWSDSEIITMARALPVCLRRSEAKLQTTLNFFMNELGYTAAYLATHPKMLVYSLEKRVMPRNSVLEILKEKKLLKYNFSLCSVVALSEVKFLDDFVLPYCDFVPHLYEAYPNATGHLQTIR